MGRFINLLRNGVGNRPDLILIHAVQLVHALIRLCDRVHDLGNIEGYFLSVSLDHVCFYIHAHFHSLSIVYYML